MIEFNGELSPKCKNFILKMDAKKDRKLVLILACLVSLVVIAGIFIWEFDLLISAGIVVGVFLMAVIAGIPRKTDKTGLLFPTKVGVEDGFVYAENNTKLNLSVPIDRVYEVVDMGEWYFIKVGTALYTDPRFCCQKDLLTKGTIEQFEKLFEEQLTRLEN